MKDGASDVIHKPFRSRDVSGTIQRELAKSGRLTHDLCITKPRAFRHHAGKGVVLAIPGERDRRRIRIAVNEMTIPLPEKSLKVLLHLMVAHVTGALVHKSTLGAKGDQGFKDISRLRQELKPALEDGVDIIKTDYHGNFSLTENVTIGNCDVDKLTSIGDRQISALAAQLRNELEARQPKSEGTP
jgi:DNA-binding response OmpR family regulator